MPRFLDEVEFSRAFRFGKRIFIHIWRLLVRRGREVQRENGDDNIYLE